ncbi:MAG: hypothetical protein ACYSU0_12555 [Planctomycetota bacterium]|jgi:hypothetical protein
MIGTGRQAIHANLPPLLRPHARSDAEVGHRTTSLCQLGHIAIQLGRKLMWDPEGERFAGDPAANRMLSRPMREPWSL